MTTVNLNDVAGTSDDSDYSSINPDVIRTIIGEGDPSYVASVLRNRQLKSGGIDYNTLINDQSQFSARNQPTAWAKNSQIAENSPQYQKALAVAGPILTGAVSPATTADSFHATSVTPSWDKGNGIKGPDGQLYFDNAYAPPKVNLMDVTGASTGIPTSGSLPTFTPVGVDPGTDGSPAKPIIGASALNHGVRFTNLSSEIPTDAQSSTFNTLSGANQYDENQPLGSLTHPYALNSSGQLPPGAGTYYVDSKGKLSSTPGAALPSAPITGFGQGIADTVTSFGNLFGNSEALDRLKAEQMQYGAQHGGDPVSGAGRLLGQTIPTTLALGGLGALGDLGAHSVPTIAPVVDFLGGSAGKGFIVNGTKFAANPLLRGASLAANGALNGAGAAAITSSANPNVPLSQQMTTGALTGAVLNPTISAAGSKLVGGFTNALNTALDPAHASLLNDMVNKFNIPIRTGQAQRQFLPSVNTSVNPAAAAADALDTKLASIPGSKSNLNATGQLTDWNAAAAKTMDPNASNFTESAMAKAKSSNGAVFNDVGSRNNITNTGALLTKVGSIINDADVNGLPEGPRKTLLDLVSNIGSSINNGVLPGTGYNALIRTGSALDKTIEESGPAQYYALKIRSALDDALQAEVSPADLSSLQKARSQYWSMKTVEPLADRSGVSGLINPLDLKNAVVNNSYNSAYSNASDLGRIADGAQAFYKPVPTSNTPKNLFESLGGIKGALGTGAALIGGNEVAHALHLPAINTDNLGLWGLGAAGAIGAKAIGVGYNAAKTAILDSKNNSMIVRNKLISGLPVINPNTMSKYFSPVPSTTIPVNNLFNQQQQGSK